MRPLTYALRALIILGAGDIASAQSFSCVPTVPQTSIVIPSSGGTFQIKAGFTVGCTNIGTMFEGEIPFLSGGQISQEPPSASVPGTAITITVTYTAGPNTGAIRQGKIDVTSGTTVVPITITQNGTLCVYDVNPLAINLRSGIDSRTISLTASPASANTPPSSCTWNASTAASWINVTPPQSSGNGTITLSAVANASGYPRTATISIADKVISVAQASSFCQSGVISSVLLPAHGVQPIPIKPWQISYGDLHLDFTVNSGSGVLCEASSGVGRLPVLATFGLTQGHFADSVANADFIVYERGSVVPGPVCSFSRIPFTGVNNDCILNGTASSAGTYYAKWHTDGFQTVLLPGVTDPVSLPESLCVSPNTCFPFGNSGPLTFWVDLNQLGVSPETATMDSTLRTAEAFIHTTLIDHLSAVARYTVIQDPGDVDLLVIDQHGRTTGKLPDGRVTRDIPGTFYLASETNPGVVFVHGAGNGKFKILLRGRTNGSFNISIATTYPDGPIAEDSFNGSISQGELVSYSTSIDDASAAQSTIQAANLTGDLNGDGVLDCKDLVVVQEAFGKITGQSGFNAWADVNHDGVVNDSDANIVKAQLPPGTACVATVAAGFRFVPITPCRAADTRNPNDPLGGSLLAAQNFRDFALPRSSCGIPADAIAYSLNVTVVPNQVLQWLTVWPSGQPKPTVSTLNSLDGRIKANAAIVPAGASGAISVFATDDTHVVIDANGYFVPNTTPSALGFYPLAPCRVVDTRLSSGSLGGPSMVAGQKRDFPLLASACNVSGGAQAYSVNITAVPKGPLAYLTTWPTGKAQPFVSTLNAPTGAVTANAAIVPAGVNGAISVFATNDTDLIIDINGYFGPPGINALSFYPVTPCRAFDSRLQSSGEPFKGTITVAAPDYCISSTTTQAFILNATVVPASTLDWLTLWTGATPSPIASTLNAYDGTTTSNMAIVPDLAGAINAFASKPTHLIVDVSGYFAP